MIAKRIFIVLFAVSLAASIGFETRHLNSRQTPVLKVDGGRPVPPVPPNPSLTARIPQATQMLEADGGRPVPPVPPNPSLTAGIPQATQTLEADGGRPVPPVPPNPSGFGAINLRSQRSV